MRAVAGLAQQCTLLGFLLAVRVLPGGRAMDYRRVLSEVIAAYVHTHVSARSSTSASDARPMRIMAGPPCAAR